MNSASYLANAGVYLINIVFGLYIIAVMTRFLLQQARADFYNPVAQFLLAITNPVLRYLRRWVPGYLGVDWPSIILMVVLQGLEICLTGLVVGAGFPAPAGLPLLIVAHLLQLCIWIYLVVIFVQILISWINPHAHTPVTLLLYQMTAPLLRPLRRRFPPAGGIDWSPLIAIVVLNLLLLLVVAPLRDIGTILAGYPIRIQ